VHLVDYNTAINIMIMHGISSVKMSNVYLLAQVISVRFGGGARVANAPPIFFQPRDTLFGY
jgi:hypothetical protein